MKSVPASNGESIETRSHYRARYYEQNVGRFLGEDPIRFDAGVNFYQYADGDPVSKSDPLGLDTKVCYYPSNRQPWGHIGFGVPQLGDQGTFGFYPTGNPFNSPGEVKPDSEHKPTACKTIPADENQDQCMLRCRIRKHDTPGSYKVTSSQCTSFVRDCLKECGLPSGDYNGPRPWPFFDNLPPKSPPPALAPYPEGREQFHSGW